MKTVVVLIGKAFLFTAAILGMVALVCFALGVSLVAYPYKRVSRGNFSALMDAATSAGKLMAASGFLLQNAKKQPETASPQTQPKGDESGTM